MRYLYRMLLIVSLIGLITPDVYAQTPSDDLYRVGVNDIIDIKVLDHDDLRTVTTVTPDGTITFPFLGTISVKDKTVSEISEVIKKGLSDGYIKFPVVSVSLTRSESKKVYAYGELLKRGEFPYSENMTLLELLSITGGLSPDGRYGEVKIRRKQKNSPGFKDMEIDIASTLRSDAGKEIILQPDDIFIVERNETFLIQGEVAKRGLFVLEKDMTVLRALLQAGGVTEEGRYGRIKLRRRQQKASGGFMDVVEAGLNDGVIEDNRVEDTLLKPDDILMVERNKSFEIQGEALKRGRFVLERNMTVLSALLQAGGVTDNALFGKIKLRRKKGEKNDTYLDLAESDLHEGVIEDRAVEEMLLQPEDILLIERNDTILIQGEVAKRGRFVMESDMTVVNALLQAGGVTDDGLYGKIKLRRKRDNEHGGYDDIAESELNDGVIDDKKVENMLLRAEDILVVEKNRTYFIYGEANRIGEFVYKKDMTVLKALILASGFTKWGSESRVEILRKSEGNKSFEVIKVNIKDAIDGDASADVNIQPGDIVLALKGIF